MATVVLALLLTAGAADGQGAPGLRFVGGLGYEEGGPGPSLVESLTDAGWDDDRLVTDAGWLEQPVYFREGLNVVAFLGAQYRFSAPFSIEVLGSNGQRGHAEGYNSADGETLVVRHASLLASFTGGVHLGPFRLAAGPIMNATSWQVTRGGRDAAGQGVITWGSEVTASGSVRASEVLLSLRAGLRRFPSTDLRQELNTPIHADYQSFFVGVTIVPVD